MEALANLLVRDIMIPRPLVVAPSQSVQDVVQAMNGLGVGAVLVAEGDQLVGIFTERDLLRHTAAAPPGWRLRPVSDWMTAQPVIIQPDDTWETAMALMVRQRVRHLPVSEAGRLVGLVASRDLLARRAEHLDQLVQARTQELQRANEQLRQREQELLLHMAVAGRLQARLLPEKPPQLPEIACAARYAPLDPLGGDYYDFAHPGPRQLGILIADASGHSIPAAMVAIMTRAAFADSARRSLQPSQVLTALNQRLHGLTGEHFVTAFYGVFDCDRRTFIYANAGHPYPYRYAAGAQSCEPLAARGLMLGVFPDVEYEDQQLQFEPGDRLLCYTDGVVDCRNPEDESFGAARLVAYLAAHGQESAEPFTEGLDQWLAAFRRSRPPGDDMTLLAAEIG